MISKLPISTMGSRQREKCLGAGAAGFTLLELLVSMSILSLLIVLLLGMVDNATKMWRQSENRVDAYREARAALNVIASDMAAIYMPANTNFFFLNDKPTNFSSASEPHLNGVLFFLSSFPGEAQGTNELSDLCTVGYFAGFDKTSLTGKGEPSMNLYRYFRGSNKTFAALEDDDLASGMSVGTSTADSEVLAKNVVGFEIKAYTITTNSPPRIEVFTNSPTTPYPSLIEITLSAISNDAAKRLTTQSQWTDTNSATLRENTRTFSKRIVLKRAPTP